MWFETVNSQFDAYYNEIRHDSFSYLSHGSLKIVAYYEICIHLASNWCITFTNLLRCSGKKKIIYMTRLAFSCKFKRYMACDARQSWEHFLKCLKPFGMRPASIEKGSNKREKILKNVPRVRIELKTFRFLIQIMRLMRCLLR